MLSQTPTRFGWNFKDKEQIEQIILDQLRINGLLAAACQAF